MKRTSGLLLLATLTALLLAPTPAHARYVDGMNMYQYVRSNPVRYVDPNGTEIQALCDIDEYLKKAGVTGYKIEKLEWNKKFAYFRKTAKGKGNDLKTEILVTMINSPRRFVVKDGSVENLDLHVKARINIIEAAKTVKFAFGKDKFPNEWEESFEKGDVYAALDGLWKNPKEYRMMCLAATYAVFYRGQAITMGNEAFNGAAKKGLERAFILPMPSEDINDWVPGDWGYVRNLDYWQTQDATKKANVEDGEEGENIIYVGKANDGKWWGFTGAGPTYKTLDEWVVIVGGWAKLDKNKALNQKKSMVDTKRDVPHIGLGVP